MNIEWLENIEIDTDKEWIKFGKVIDEYDKVFPNLHDFTSANCVDYEELTKKLKKCILYKTPYSKMYGSDYTNNNIEI